MQKLIILFLVILQLPLRSQVTLPAFIDTTLIRHEIIIQGKADLYSSSLQNSFSNKLLFGGTFSSEEISKQVSLQDNHNSIGIESTSNRNVFQMTLFIASSVLRNGRSDVAFATGKLHTGMKKAFERRSGRYMVSVA